jgi:hypothetical protein
MLLTILRKIKPSPSDGLFESGMGLENIIQKHYIIGVSDINVVYLMLI